MTQKVIVIDPGHGSGPKGVPGFDPGAVHGILTEAEVNVEMSKTMKFLFTELGYRVVLTHDGNDGAKPDLNWRIRMAKGLGAVALLSVHHDANDPNASSFRPATHRQGVYYAPGEPSRKLALALQKEHGPKYWAEPSEHSRFKGLYIDAFPDHLPSVLLEIDRMQYAAQLGTLGKQARLIQATPIVRVVDRFLKSR